MHFNIARSPHRWHASIALLLCLATPVAAQGRGRHLNVEPPQVKPISIGVFPSFDEETEMHRFMFVCNTPNDTVEIYHLGEESSPTEPRLMAEVLVGKSPVSVLPTQLQLSGAGTPPVNAFLTANFLGDSVSYVGFSFGTIFGQLFLETHTVGTIHVGDEPMDIAVRPASAEVRDPLTDELIAPAFPPRAFVAMRTASSYAVLDLDQLNFRIATGPNQGTDGGPVRLEDVQLVAVDGDGSKALKEPHRILMHPHRDELWILGHQGGNGNEVAYQSFDVNGDMHGQGTLEAFDFDIARVRFDPLLGPHDAEPNVTAIAGLGTTNFNMEFSEDGERLYVVGTRALSGGSEAIEGTVPLASALTGFVRTSIYRVNARVQGGGANPFVPGELEGGTPLEWDANLDWSDPANSTQPVSAVAAEESLAHLTDIIVRDGGDDDILYLAAFHSDKIARVAVDKDGQGAGGGSLEHYEHLSSELRSPLWDTGAADDVLRSEFKGARGIALNDASGDLYVCNSNEASVVMLLAGSDPAYDFGASTQLSMRGRQEPAYIRDGRKFLYSTRFSGNGFVSCASCHVDARSDQQAWLLTPEVGLMHPFDVDLDDLPGDEPGFGFEFPAEKGHMVTQSLQGLTNFEMNPVRMVAPPEFTPYADSSMSERFEPLLEFDLVSNAPYHWRGDKPSFLDFNEAFVGLQGMGPDSDGVLGPYERSSDGEGLGPHEMLAFEEFVFSIHYPPNPVQPISRDYGEETPESRGLRGFHESPAFFDGGGSCATCHALPEGSINRPSLTFFNQVIPETDITGQDLLPILGRETPLEAAALRGFFQKSGLLEENSGFSLCSGASTIRSADLGLGRNGFLSRSGTDNADTLTLQSFMERVCSTSASNVVAEEVTRFVYALDWGVAPIVGRSFTVRRTPTGQVTLAGEDPSPLMATWIEEAQQGNCDVVASFHFVKVGTNGFAQSFVYDPVSELFIGRGEGLSQSALLDRLENPPQLGLILELAGLLDPGTAEIWTYLNRIVIEAVPLGTGHEKVRVAREPASGTLPCPLQVGTSPNEAYRDVPTFSREDPNGVGLNPLDREESAFNRTVHHLRRGLDLELFGDYQAWDAPRRLQFVAGAGEFPMGTVIELYVHHQDPASTAPPTSTGSPCGDVPSSCVLDESCATRFEIPIYPTKELGGSAVVWESAIEFEPEVLYSLMLGGPFEPNVAAVWSDPPMHSPATPPALSEAWNSYWWRAIYEDSNGGTLESAFVQQPILYPDVTP